MVSLKFFVPLIRFTFASKKSLFNKLLNLESHYPHGQNDHMTVKIKKVE